MIWAFRKDSYFSTSPKPSHSSLTSHLGHHMGQKKCKISKRREIIRENTNKTEIQTNETGTLQIRTQDL